MSHPLVSVIMPVFNGEEHVDQALDSLIRQTLRRIEIIAIDDGSQDDTWNCLTAYAARDGRIRLFRNATNIGLSQSLNEGIAVSRGAYIARQDHDDVSLPTRLEEQVAYLESHREIGLLGTAYYRLQADGKRVVRHPPSQHTEIRWRLLFGNLWCHASMMFRRELLFERPGYSREFPTAQDFELWSRLITITRGATLHAPLFEYRKLDTGLSISSDGGQAIEAKEISSRSIERELHRQGLPPGTSRAIRRIYMLPSGLTEEDFHYGEDLLNLWDSFASNSDVNPEIVKDLKQKWLRRFFARVHPGQIAPLVRSGLMQRFFRIDPLGVAVGIGYQWPRSAARRKLSSHGSTVSSSSH